jgi:hypothetical protein
MQNLSGRNVFRTVASGYGHRSWTRKKTRKRR